MDEIIVITLWAPSAIQVDFLLFDSPDFSHPKEELEMMFDSSNGTWIIHGRRKELYQMYYNFRVTVFHPKENKVMTSIASDPYARSLAADGRRAHIFDVENDASAKPEGWECAEISISTTTRLVVTRRRGQTHQPRGPPRPWRAVRSRSRRIGPFAGRPTRAGRRK